MNENQNQSTYKSFTSDPITRHKPFGRVFFDEKKRRYKKKKKELTQEQI